MELKNIKYRYYLIKKSIYKILLIIQIVKGVSHQLEHNY